MNRIKRILMGLMASVLVAAPVTAFAETTTVVPAKEIVVQGSGGSAGTSAATDAASVAGNSAAGADQLAGNAGTIVSNAKEGGSSLAQGAVDTANSVSSLATGANNMAGTGTNTTGLDLFGIFTRLDALLTDSATNGISLLLKIVYWSSVLSIVLGMIAVVWALLPWTKTKVWKPLLGLVSGFAFFALVSTVAGVDLFNNPITQLVHYILTGQ